MKKIRTIVFLLFCLFLMNAQTTFKRTMKLMGNRFDITVVANNEAEGNVYIHMAVTEISRIEKLISSWDKNSQTSEINKNAGIKPVKVTTELFDLIERSIAISKLTDGAFDISYASMGRIWKFDGSMTEMPSEEEIKSSVVKVGLNRINQLPKIECIIIDENGNIFTSDNIEIDKL